MGTQLDPLAFNRGFHEFLQKQALAPGLYQKDELIEMLDKKEFTPTDLRILSTEMRQRDPARWMRDLALIGGSTIGGALLGGGLGYAAGGGDDVATVLGGKIGAGVGSIGSALARGLMYDRADREHYIKDPKNPSQENLEQLRQRVEDMRYPPWMVVGHGSR